MTFSAKTWIRAALVGALGSLVMFVVLFVGIHITGVAPFNQPPSAAFLEVLGLNVGPLPILAHFGYGATWSVMLLAWKGGEVRLSHGILLAAGLWLFMMIVYSPIIGWGVFGFGGAGHSLATDHPLYLGHPGTYVVLTAALHLVFGAIIGKGNAAWTVAVAEGADSQATDAHSPASA